MSLNFSPLIIKSLLLSVALFMSSCKHEGCMDPNSFNYDPKAEKDDGSCVSMVGCSGYQSGMNNSGSLGTTFNDAYWDNLFSQEVNLQRNFFPAPATVYVLYEPSAQQRNAYANNNGQILFGYHMFWTTLYQYGDYAISGILAHEWGHRMQFSNGWNNAFGNPHLELEADALSGFYMCLYKNYPWSSTGLQGYFTSTYNTGDYNFNSPGHHGTPQQRLAASYLGFELAQYAINNNNTFTWGQLHQMITDSLRQNIVGWKTGNPNSPLVAICSGKKDVKDIQPAKLSEEEKRKLRPISDQSE